MSYHRQHSQASTVAHNWAHLYKANFKKDNHAGSLFYEGRTIYSYGYHFPIASISEKDNNLVFFTTRGYSNTTSKHISAVRGACSHMELVFCYDPKSAQQGHHTQNIEQFEREAKNAAMSLTNARKPEKYLEVIAHQRDMLNKYVKACKVKKKDLKTLTRYIWIESTEGGKKATLKERKAIEENRRKQALYLNERARIDLECFRNFKSDTIDQLAEGISRNTAYLRYNKKTKRVETSKGVQIPVVIARAFYRWVQLCITSGGCDGNCNKTLKVGDHEWKVSEVTNEDFTLGCHTIPMTEAEAIATQLKWKK